MKLPLDNFQVLGVSPGSSARSILTMLERKLDNCNYQGFSKETLRMRKYLLEEYSKPLLETEKRKEFELDYQASDSTHEEDRFIDIPNGYEIAGLLLLLEAGQFDECLGLANEMSLLKHKDFAVGITKTSDLCLLIAYATVEYGRVLKSKRYYDSCARILEKGLMHVKDKVYLANIENTIAEELEEIIPFRILDLLSREMDEPIRELGIELLNDFVMKRGGLDCESNLYMIDIEFKSFFRQIRYFLTVQEQIDLYHKWCAAGSKSACFLLGISLVASGFARRKPERLVQALEVMNNLDSQELRDMIAYISLLLGKIEDLAPASSVSEESDYTSPANPSEVRLGQLCADCREWLERDVLEGYRDLEADPDLEAYFSDRDVTSFIETQDRQILSQKNTTKMLFDPVDLSHNFLQKSNNEKRIDWGDLNQRSKIKDHEPVKYSNTKSLTEILRSKWILAPLIVVSLFIFLFFILKRSGQKSNSSQMNEKNAITLSTSPQKLAKKDSSKTDNNKNNLNSFEKYPSKVQLLTILSEWLSIKTRTLAGEEIPDTAKNVATPQAINRLQAERKEDSAKGEKQIISAQVLDLQVPIRQDNQIEILARLSYSDKRINKEGVAIEKTPKYVFKKTYILVNSGSKWLVQ